MRVILPRSLFTAAALMAGLLLMGGPAPAAKPPASVSPDLASLAAQAGDSELVEVIIQTEEPGDEPQVREQVERRRGVAKRSFRKLGGFSAELPVEEVLALASDPGVRHVSLDRPVFSSMDVAAPAGGAGWTRTMHRAGGSLTGRGVGVAVIDSGILSHEDLAPGAVRARVDFISPSGKSNQNNDDPYGHGTHIAGIIAGQPVMRPEDDGIVGGMAPGAHLVSLRVLDRNGRGTTSDVIAALEWCVEHMAEHGLRVVNLSLGQPVAEPTSVDPLARAVENAWEAGLVVVASAGNRGWVGDGYGTISSPGNVPMILTVGAFDDAGTVSRRDDDLPPFTSRGPSRFDVALKPDLVAPGTSVISLRRPQSTLDRLMPEARVSINSFGRSRAFEPRYFEMNGTSMAAAVVSGAAALLLESDPTLTPADVKARLMVAADRTLISDIFSRGAGALDVTAALEVRGHAISALSPPVLPADGGIRIGDTGAAWGDPILWSLESLYGDPALWGDEIAGTLGFLDDPCITGDGMVWQNLTGQGLVWQNLAGQGLVWQNLAGEGLVWQNLSGDGLVWQNLSGDGLVWQNLVGEGLVWQNAATGEICPI